MPQVLYIDSTRAYEGCGDSLRAVNQDYWPVLKKIIKMSLTGAAGAERVSLTPA